MNLYFPELEQVRRLGLENKLDKVIWDFAKMEQFTILTFDADFYDLSLLHGHPPKLIWVKSGNMTSKNLEKLLLEKANQIKIFIEDISFPSSQSLPPRGLCASEQTSVNKPIACLKQ